MAWTTAVLVNEYIPAIDLIAEPTAFDSSIIVAERDLSGRLLAFIASTSIAAWTLRANTPELVVSWATEMAAAYYLSTFENYHLQPEIPDNPAAVVYARVLAQIESAKFGGIVIRDISGNAVAVKGITVSAATDYITYLPVSQGGTIQD